MTVFSGVVAIVSPRLVGKLAKDYGDVFEKIQMDYGVACTRTADDMCMIQGEWEAVSQVHFFLDQAETAKIPSKPAPSSHGGAEDATGNGIQIVAAWGNFQEECLVPFSDSSDEEANADEAKKGFPEYGRPVFPGLEERKVSTELKIPKLYKSDAKDITKEKEGHTHKRKGKPIQISLQNKPDDPDEVSKKIEVLEQHEDGEESERTFTSKQMPKYPLRVKLVAKKSTSGKAKNKGKMGKTGKKNMAGKSKDSLLLSNNSTEKKSSIFPVLNMNNESQNTNEDEWTECEFCSKKFRNNSELAVHTEIYHNDRYVEGKNRILDCPMCGKTYNSKHALEEHMYLHVGARPFACTYCSASFNHRKSLRRHVLRHEQTQDHRCKECNMTFPLKESLETHRTLEHGHFQGSTQGKYKCKQCPSKFSNIVSYRNHLRSHSKKKLKQSQDAAAEKKQKESLEKKENVGNTGNHRSEEVDIEDSDDSNQMRIVTDGNEDDSDSNIDVMDTDQKMDAD